MGQPYEECPQFDTCSCNNCPLDPDIAERIVLTGEEKCETRKRTRARIGVKYAEILKYKGLKGREYNGLKRVGSLDHYFTKLTGKP